uniref:Uncharacterized protein n=1 Tax=Methanococcus maripaludis (strain C6 / ATCC BAA-1332) TaxID=444158 RepID=A9A7F2_METM6
MANIVLSLCDTDLIRVLCDRKSIIIRNKFEGTSGDTVYIYQGDSVRKLWARFTIEKIICEVPAILWKMTEEKHGISKYDFYQYCRGMNPYYGIYIKDLQIFQPPIYPYEVFDNFIAPRNYLRITGSCRVCELIRSGEVQIVDNLPNPYSEENDEE